MSAAHTILRDVSQVTMAAGFIGFWVCLLYKRQRSVVEQRDHKAGVQTLFSGRK